MSASLVRKALDETTLASEEKLDHLSKKASKRFKPPTKKVKKTSKDKLLKQNLKILKTLEQKVRSKSLKESKSSGPVVEEDVTKSLKKLNSKKQKKNKSQQSESVFTEEDFEKFEREYFVKTLSAKIFNMAPILQLILSVGFMSALACLLFGAPFVPPFRTLAVNVLFLLTVLGNIFVFFVIITTVVIYIKSKKDDKHEDVDSQDKGYERDLPVCKKKK